MTKPHVVVVGAGFGGLSATRALLKAGCTVTLIDRHPYTTFQPLLYQVAIGGLNPGDVTFSLRSLSARHKRAMRYRRAAVTGINFEQRRVFCDTGEPVGYDYLILAQGVGANFFGIPGADKYARCIYTRADALEVRDIIFTGLETLTTQPPEKKLSLIVVGGGATGVEMAGALAEMKSMGIPSAYPELDPGRLQVSLVEMSPNLLGPFSPRLRRYAQKELQKHGVDVRVHSAIKEVHPASVDLNDGTTLPAALVIWAAGVGAHDVVKTWGVPQGRGGRILIDEHCRVQGHDRVFAIGDAAINPDNPTPQLAQPAMQMGAYVGHQIDIDSSPDMPEQGPFAYKDKGTMATISRNAAVVELKRFSFTGLPAWAAWVVLHLTFLLGGRNRVQAMINLGVRYAMYPRTAQAIVGDVLDTPGAHAELEMSSKLHYGEID